jgi:chorismate dehydratase
MSGRRNYNLPSTGGWRLRINPAARAGGYRLSLARELVGRSSELKCEKWMDATGPNESSGLRIGAVSYLNTVPLVEYLPELLPGARLSFDHPSRLADDLAAGRLDVALAPSIELARHPEWRLVSDACIGCRGPVLSVKALFRVAPEEVRTLALDAGSRTSAGLAQILLAEKYCVRPELLELPLGASAADVDADAVVVIGDRAIREAVDASLRDAEFESRRDSATGWFESRRGSATVWDLGERWREWTGLPFVFAAWAAGPGVDVANVDRALAAARDRGVADLPAIARRQSAAMGLPPELVRTYLRDHLHFTLGAEEKRGLELFFEKAGARGLIDDRRTVGSPPSPSLRERYHLRSVAIGDRAR